METISSPKIGSIVAHTGWRQSKTNYPCDVYIMSGYLLDPISTRVSNYWSWKRILPDGTLGELENGYGDFTKSINQYDIEVIIKQK